MKGGLLLLLGIPFALYVAWQINGVVRTDLVLSEVPADRGGSKEQLAAARAKAAAWAVEARKAAAVAWQYRPAAPEDASADEAAAGLIRASATRSADLDDLDRFLSGVENPTFNGKLRDSYAKWIVDAKLAREDERAVRDWLDKLPTIASAADANRAMEKATELINQYSGRSKFADKGKAALWRVRARLLVIDALAKPADQQYRTAVRVKLPLKEGANDVTKAVETLRGVKAQIEALKGDVKRAEDDKVPLSGSILGEIEAKEIVAHQCAAGEELLKLFAKDDLFTDATGAAAWLKQVNVQYGNTKDEGVKAILREKVQEFCEAFIPAAVRLDDTVLIRGKSAPRKSVTVKFVEDGVTKRVQLSDEPDGLNEFNLGERKPGETTFVVYAGSEEYPKDVKPTKLSEAARLFSGERKKLSDSTTGPKWTAKSVEELKKKCVAQKDLVDQLQLPGAGTVGNGPKIWTRLTGLAEGLKATPDLIGNGP